MATSRASGRLKLFGKEEKKSRTLEVTARRAALLQVSLVVLLGAIERTCSRNFRSDRPTKFSARFQRRLGFLCRCFLFRRVKENRGAILRAKVGSLAIHLC